VPWQSEMKMILRGKSKVIKTAKQEGVGDLGKMEARRTMTIDGREIKSFYHLICNQTSGHNVKYISVCS